MSMRFPKKRLKAARTLPAGNIAGHDAVAVALFDLTEKTIRE